MRSIELKSTRALVVAFALSTTCFLSATAMTVVITRSIGDSARKIALDTAPGIQRLSRVRGNLRHLEVVLTGFAAGDMGVDEAVFPVILGQIQAQFDAYLATAASTPEQALRGAMTAQWNLLRNEVIEFVTPDHPHVVSDRHFTRVRMDIESLDAMFVQSLDLRTRDGNELAGRILAKWNQANGTGALLTIISVLLTLMTAFLAIRLVRQQTRMLAMKADEAVQFAGRVAHDVLSPLSPIKMFLDLSAKMGIGNPMLEKVLPSTRSALGRLVGTVDALLAFAKAGAQAPKGAACEVRAVVQGVVDDQQSTAAAANITIDLRRIDDGWVPCASGVLASVLSNLMRNAMKYMGEAALRRVIVRVRNEGPKLLRFEVQDTGPGIAPEWLESIFEPFMQAPTRKKQDDGIGLGLATVKRLVVAHGGDVGVESMVGSGSCFWFTLPKTRAPKRESTPVAMQVA